MKRQWRNIIGQFAIEGLPIEVSSIGNGLINDTFLVRTVEEDVPDYILQRINSTIFTDVGLMQRNIERVTDHIRQKLVARGESDIDRKVLRFIKTKSGQTYCHIDDDYWRMSVYIKDSQSFEEVTPEFAYLTGKAFSDFQNMLSDLPGEPLGNTIPDFHNMEFRLKQLQEAVRDDRAGRLAKMQPIVNEILARGNDMCLAERMGREGTLPRRITHCDTKVNNMLFDHNGKFLCVIDLDTTMPGFVLSDFGDFIRTAANTGAEDDKDLDRVKVNMEVFRSFTKGYLEGSKPFITETEVKMLPYGAKLLTYMQTVRFLTDYLNGDTYYKIKYPEHNYDRTMAQYTLLKSIESHESEMNDFINTLL
ncbi:MAG: aminoglycoside phosphotransferase family protein [Bacteroidales bacterium]|nr:aminoglycoside phosphotransferase family protein [Bacteroidales bacterium]MDD3201162.1 aminoglycoside phosphotransferase family protein [Bacteroidales bacterium]